MKNLNLFIRLLVGFLVLSCSSDDDNEPQVLMEELLINGSPWTFDHYELISIIDSGNSNYTQTDIENYTDDSQNGNIVIFKSDGTGSSSLPNEGTDNWGWEIVNNNQLKLNFGSGESDILENITVTSSQMVIEEQSVSYDESVQYEVLHYGKLIYK